MSSAPLLPELRARPRQVSRGTGRPSNRALSKSTGSRTLWTQTLEIGGLPAPAASLLGRRAQPSRWQPFMVAHPPHTVLGPAPCEAHLRGPSSTPPTHTHTGPRQGGLSSECTHLQPSEPTAGYSLGTERRSTAGGTCFWRSPRGSWQPGAVVAAGVSEADLSPSWDFG